MTEANLGLFSADRRGRYGAGPLVLSKAMPQQEHGFMTSHRNDFTADDILRHMLDLFPEGLSYHGWDFATRPSSLPGVANGLDASSMVELTFEYVRRAHYPQRPSRMQSFFAFDDLERVQAFSRSTVFEVRPTAFFKADMAWLNAGNQFGVASFYAHEYWKGAASNEPDWEYLLVPPVEIEVLKAA
jgi:hypothetical protein